METRYPARPREVFTLFGPITLQRRDYRHRPSGTGRCPLDEALGLEYGGATPAVARLLLRAATQRHSYQEAAQALEACTGLTFDPRDLGRLCARTAPSLIEALGTVPPAAAPSVGASCIPVLYVSADGTGTPMRRDALLDRAGKQDDGSARTREAKLGCVFTQHGVDEEGHPLRDPDSTSYVGTDAGCRESGLQLRAEATRRGLGRARQVVYLGDGAASGLGKRPAQLPRRRANPRLLPRQRTRRPARPGPPRGGSRASPPPAEPSGASR